VHELLVATRTALFRQKYIQGSFENPAPRMELRILTPEII